LLALAGSLAVGQTKEYLTIGDAAPPLKPHRWIKGDPIPRFEKGKVYVVEFWATWCGPCKENIPHLTELAKKYKGKATIAGIGIWETNDRKDTAYLAKVERFVKDMGDKMDYVVAVDNPAQTIGDTWMRKAGEGGIPTTFVVGKDGRIAWIGHPARLEEVLSAVVEDRFDVAAARARRATEVEVTRPISEAAAAKDYRKVVALIDAQLAKNPDAKPRYAYDRLMAQFHYDVPAAKAYGEAIVEETGGDIGVYRMIASIFASQPDLSPEAYAYGQEVIERALAKDQMRFMFLAMKAAVLDHQKQLDEAIRWQEKAIAEAKEEPNTTAEFVAFLEKSLADMRKRSRKE
jgi:thiol-disulfide isomerase/thioredoxin